MLIPRLEQLVNQTKGIQNHLDQQLTGQDAVTSGSCLEPERPAPGRRAELQGEHRTAPHELFTLWPSLAHLLQEANINVGDDYVAKVEDRGMLRLHGSGEDMRSGEPESPARSDDGFPGASSLPVGDREDFPAYARPIIEARSLQHATGNSKIDGSLDLEPSTVNTLWGNYVRNMHYMHPFLDRSKVQRLIDKFVSRHSSGQHSSQPQRPSIVNHGRTGPLSKRRRFNGSESCPNGLETGERMPGSLGGIIDHSPQDALVWLILALGRICMHRQDLPAPVQDRPQVAPWDGSPASREVVKNADVIPGLVYYAKATEIMGAQSDGTDLIHAQMFLLAGLYKGQLARVKESMSWITKAGKVVRILLDKDKLYNERYWIERGDVDHRRASSQHPGTNPRQDLIVLASWTSMQLESDILADLRLPSSGIQYLEDFLPMPHNLAEEEVYGSPTSRGQADSENCGRFIMFYTAQLFLRKRLNQVHRQLYGAECLDRSLKEVSAALYGHIAVLDGWRETLPQDLKWNEGDPPAPDILSARLRAKYWPHLKDWAKVEDVALDMHGRPRDKADIRLFEAIEGMGEPTIREACRKCVEAAMQSTVALDRVPPRLIVTNIHGTAHAQFGNMLVLSAVWRTEHLRGFVDGKQLSGLLDRTIRFLRRLSPISPTCRVDCSILVAIQRVVSTSLREGEGAMLHLATPNP